MKRHIIKYLLIFILVIAGCTPTKSPSNFSNDVISTPPPPPPPPISELISTSWAAYNNNDLPLAKSTLVQIETDYANREPFFYYYPPYWNVSGWIAAREQQLNQALNAFNNAIQYDTSFDTTLADAYAGQASINQINNQYSQAILGAETLLTIAPNYNPGHDLLNVSHIYLLLAEAYYYNGDLVKSLQNVQVLDPAYTLDLNSPDAALALLKKIQSL